MTTKLPTLKTLWRSRRSLLAVLLVLLISPILLFVMDRAKAVLQDLSNTYRLVQKSLKDIEELENGVACTMSQIDPFAEYTLETHKLPTLTCEGPDWVNCYKSDCSVTEDILKTVKEVVCYYRNIIYVDDRIVYIGYPTQVSGNEKFSLNRSDYVKIDCTGKEIDRPDVHASWSGCKAGFRPIVTESIPPGREDSFNVMILCLGSMSRIRFMNKLPNSYKYLTDKLNAEVLKSYNIVGDGTTGALFPILTGKPEEEHIYHKKRGTRKRYINPKKFIFYMLKKYGYRTAYLEDMPWSGSAQPKFNWFRSQPTDHYLRTMTLADVSQGETWSNGLPNKHCIGDRPQYELVMNLAAEFLQQNGKKFCFALIVDTEYKNYTVSPTADKSLHSFLQTLSARRTLEDTLVLIMGDHGRSSVSTTRNTSLSKLEERLPFMAILLPEKVKQRRPETWVALKNNVNVLTTPFDIHATILDVLDLKNKSNKQKLLGSDLPRAMSLLEPIPKSRSCGEASVMPHWCACGQWSNVSQSDPMYEKVANILAEYIDSICTEQRSQCARRYLVRTEWVLHRKATDHLSKVNYFNTKKYASLYNHPTSDTLETLDSYFQARIIMSPDNTVFEGTMIYNNADDYFMITQRDISRISAYGDEANCISATHPYLIKYCYCKGELDNI